MIVLDIGRRDLQGKLQEILLVIFDLERGLRREVKVFLVVLIMLYQMKRQLGR